MVNYTVYTDGGCRGNPGPGAWAFIVYNQTAERIGSKSAPSSGSTTNNEMEMTAILKALEWAIKDPKRSVEICTDSAFCKSGIESWMWGWERSGWTKKSPGEIKNLEIWKEIHKACYEYKNIHGEIPTIIKVKGHSGDLRNNEVDALVNVVMTEEELK
jgi:ribonuclease HI